MGLIPRSLLRKLFVQTSKRLNWQFNTLLRVARWLAAGLFSYLSDVSLFFLQEIGFVGCVQAHGGTAALVPPYGFMLC